MESACSGSLCSGVRGVVVGNGSSDDSRVDLILSASSTAIKSTYSPMLLTSSTSDLHHLHRFPSISYLDSCKPLLPLGSAGATPPRSRSLPLLIPSTSDCIACGGGGSQSLSVRPPSAMPRSSKKRPRTSSRRAPTTVLTTDTSNFQAMVQEFTGIPSPPFPSAAPAPSSSLRFRPDLFQYPSTSSPLTFRLPPFPQQRVQFPSPSPASNLFPPSSSVKNTSNSAIENNYRLPFNHPSLGSQKNEPHLRLQSPPLDFQTFLQENYTVPAEKTTGLDASLPLAEHVANELVELLPELFWSREMQSTWMVGSAVANSPRHALENSCEKNYPSSWSPSELSRVTMTAAAAPESDVAVTSGEMGPGTVVMDSLF